MTSSTPEQAATAQPEGTVYRVTLSTVNSYVIFTQRRTVTHRGTLAQLEDIARRVRTDNLLLGWWGFPVGLIWTPMALSRNAKTMRKVRELAASGAA